MESLLNVLTTKVNIISAISLKRQFEISFIDKDRWQLYLEGLGNTLIVTFFALILGIVIGAVVAIVRASYDKNYSEMKGGLGKILLAIFNIISKIYLTVVRGTPVVIQIMIMYYIIFATSNNKIFVARKKEIRIKKYNWINFKSILISPFGVAPIPNPSSKGKE